MVYHTVAEQIKYFEHISYAGVFIGMILSGHFIPLPEEALLLLSGYVVSQGLARLSIMMIVSALGAITADMILYYLSFKGTAFAVYMEKKIKTRIFEWYSKRMNTSTFSTVFISRFVPGLRFASPLVAAFVGVPWQNFLAYSALSAFIFAPLMVFVGYYFSQSITSIVEVAESVHRTLFFGSVIAIAVIIVVVVNRKLFKHLNKLGSEE